MVTRMVQIEHIEGAVILAKLDGIFNLLNTLPQSKEDKQADYYLTRKEVAEVLKVTLPTTYAWEKVGILKSYRIGNKTRFIASEILSTPKPINRKGGYDE